MMLPVENFSTGNLIENSYIYQAFWCFVRSGGTYIDSGVQGLSGYASYTWASWSNSDDRYVYLLAFYIDSIDPSGYYDRWFGFPLRCLAR